MAASEITFFPLIHRWWGKTRVKAMRKIKEKTRERKGSMTWWELFSQTIFNLFSSFFLRYLCRLRFNPEIKISYHHHFQPSSCQFAFHSPFNLVHRNRPIFLPPHSSLESTDFLWLSSLLCVSPNGLDNMRSNIPFRLQADKLRNLSNSHCFHQRINDENLSERKGIVCVYVMSISISRANQTEQINPMPFDGWQWFWPKMATSPCHQIQLSASMELASLLSADTAY